MNKAQLKEALAKKAAAGKKVLTAKQRRDFADAIRLVQGKEELPTFNLERLPGLSPMQLEALVDKLAALEKEISKTEAMYAAQIKELEKLGKEYKGGVDKLKAAGKQLSEKGHIVVETRKSVLSFTTSLEQKRPGIEQIIMKPEEAKDGGKAGDFFGRVAAQFGEEIGKGVEEIWGATKEDLTHMADVVRSFKIVEKTSAASPDMLKKAGISDVVVSLKEWLSGKADAVAQRLVKFVGDIEKWAKGFIERTKMALAGKSKAEKAMDAIMKAADKAVASAA